jgi:flagellar basal-body rod protein FlgF
MNYGLYLAASGTLTHVYRQNVYANNLANVETTGYKPDIPALTQRAPESLEDHLGFQFRDSLLDRLGGGVFAGPQSIDFAPGAIKATGGNLDVALAQRDRFFAVQYVNPQNGQTSVRLTRDGSFSRAADGTLVTQAGHRVLDINDQPITLPVDGEAKIGSDGQVCVAGQGVAHLQVARVADLSRLHKAGQNLFAFNDADSRTLDPVPDLRAGALESSAADPIKTLVDMIDSTKAATGSANLMRYFDTMMDRAVNTLGRVA